MHTKIHQTGLEQITLELYAKDYDKIPVINYILGDTKII